MTGDGGALLGLIGAVVAAVIGLGGAFLGALAALAGALGATRLQTKAEDQRQREARREVDDHRHHLELASILRALQEADADAATTAATSPTRIPNAAASRALLAAVQRLELEVRLEEAVLIRPVREAMSRMLNAFDASMKASGVLASVHTSLADWLGGRKPIAQVVGEIDAACATWDAMRRSLGGSSEPAESTP